MYKDQAEIAALLVSADIDSNLKTLYQDVFSIDNTTLNKVGAGMLADGLLNDGARFILKKDGSFKRITELGLSPYSYLKIIDTADNQKITAKLTTGKDLFKKLSEEPDTIADLEKLCALAPIHIKQGYISAVYTALAGNERPRTVLQHTVNYSVGVGETGISAEEKQRDNDEFTFGFRRLVDHVKRGASYVAKPLKLEPRKQDSNTRQHPAIYALDKFIRGLPYGKAFDLAASEGKPKSLDDKLARALTPEEDKTAAFIKEMLFGKKRQTNQPV